MDREELTQKVYFYIPQDLDITEEEVDAVNLNKTGGKNGK